MMREADIPLLINSDAHAPEEVEADFDKALAVAKEAGFMQTVRLCRRERRFVPL